MASPTTYISECDPLVHSTPSRSTSDSLASPSTAPYFAPISSSDSESSLRSPYANYLSHNRPPSMSSIVNMGWDGRVTHPRQGSMVQKYGLLDASAYPGPSEREIDDALHDPDPMRDANIDRGGSIFSARGLINLGCMSLLLACILGLFAGYPITTYLLDHNSSSDLSSTTSSNASNITNLRGLIDPDTPVDAHTRTGYNDSSKTFKLVFSDEFETEGRTFYAGDDPYFEAVDLHYWQTDDLEWYDPSAVTTKDGALQITLSAHAEHELNYTGGMLTSWNNFCFTGGIVEVAATLPGSPYVSGLWPAIWTMGNLGRVGYGATTDGLWPYSYDSCDYGTIANQSINGEPAADFEDGAGDTYHDNALSYLPGQRLSRCTCSGSSHPGPMHSDGTYVGRAAPEIDIFEALGTDVGGNVSQSGQFAPFNWAYEWSTDGNLIIPDASVTALNPYAGGAYQQAISALSLANSSCWELTEACYAVYGIEYSPGFDNAYTSWINNGKLSWTLLGGGLVADNKSEIAARPIPQEPMYIIFNLGLSTSFVTIDYDNLTLPATLSVDYVRVYQDPDNINVGCDPDDFPTADYISTYNEAYSNPNYTLWSDIGESYPGNSFLGEC